MNDKLQYQKEKLEREQMEKILDKHMKEAIFKAMEEYANLKNKL